MGFSVCSSSSATAGAPLGTQGSAAWQASTVVPDASNIDEVVRPGVAYTSLGSPPLANLQEYSSGREASWAERGKFVFAWGEGWPTRYGPRRCECVAITEYPGQRNAPIPYGRMLTRRSVRMARKRSTSASIHRFWNSPFPMSSTLPAKKCLRRLCSPRLGKHSLGLD